MSESPKNPQACLDESISSFRILLLVGSISAAVVGLFAIVFHP